MTEDDKPDFSLVLGGPLYQLFLRLRIQRQPLDLHRRRIVVITLFAWLPLLVLAALQGQAFGGVEVPFLQDVAVQARFLVALPLLIVAEVVVHKRMAPAVRQFLERGIVRDEDRPRFEAIGTSIMGWRNSIACEVFLIVLIATAGVFLREGSALQAETWYAHRTSSGLTLSLAGKWYAWVSLPIFQFMLLRWYFRCVLWFGFLWQVARLDLHLVPTHPDRAGGLGFLATSTASFAPLLLAQSAVLSGMIASLIFHEGARVQSFQLELFGAIAFALCFVLGPLCVFVPNLLAAKRQGLREYGLLANRYVREFDAKWIRGGAPEGEPFVGSADVQSLADLANSYDVVRGMRAFPFGKDTVVQLAVTTALPLLPLTLTAIPLQELLQRLLGVLL